MTQRLRGAKRGKAYLVGAGPGDPGLLTVRGRQLLDECDAIVYDALANPELLDRPGAPAAELHDVGKRGNRESTSQEDINHLLVRLVRAGKSVVRLKGGDPFVFGRGGEEAQALAEAALDFEVVPGVTAGIAAPAYAGIPVTHRGLSTAVTFVTGHEDPEKIASHLDWHALARSGGTIVVYMGVRSLPAIAAALIDGGLPPEIPAAAIEWGTHPHQRTVVATLGSLAAEVGRARINPPVITVIGWTVVLRDEIAWFDRAPLFGRRIVVTRSEDGLGRRGLASRLRAWGAETIEMPVTRIERLDPARARSVVEDIDEFQWLCFTSANGVRFFWDTLRETGRDARALAGINLCAVGPSTADALLQHGLAVDVVAERFVAEGLLAVLGQRDDLPGARVLHAAAEGARDTLPRGLEAMGADVERLALYRSVPDPDAVSRLRDMLRERPADLIAFTSGSAVRSYVAGIGEDLARTISVASIGPTTTVVARELGLDVAIEARESTLEALAEAIVDAYAADESSATVAPEPADE